MSRRIYRTRPVCAVAAFSARAQRAPSLITSLRINVCDCLHVAVGVALPGRLSLRLARRGGARQYGLPFRLRCTDASILNNLVLVLSEIVVYLGYLCFRSDAGNIFRNVIGITILT